jgi:hypothetical protein
MHASSGVGFVANVGLMGDNETKESDTRLTSQLFIYICIHIILMMNIDLENTNGGALFEFIISILRINTKSWTVGEFLFPKQLLKASFHSGKLSVDWNGQENFSLSCEL